MYWRKYELSDKRLHAAIKCILVNRSDDDQPSLPPVIRVFPETEISVFLDFADKFSNGSNYMSSAINGIHSKYYYLAHTNLNYSDKMMIIFHPGGLKYFTSLPMNHLSHRLINTDQLNDLPINKVFDRLVDFKTTAERISFLEKELINMMITPKETTVMSGDIARSIFQKGRLLTKTEFSQYTSLGLRQVQRHFLDDIGVNMKLFLRLSRFQKSKQLLLYSFKKSAINAWYDSGYYDQPQFNRDFKLFSGLLPGDVINADNICNKNVPDLKTFL